MKLSVDDLIAVLKNTPSIRGDLPVKVLPSGCILSVPIACAVNFML